MKLRKNAAPLLLALAMPCIAMGAEQASPYTPMKTDTPGKPTVPLKLQIVFAKYHGDKKIGSFPYTLAVNSDDRSSKVRIGLQVPMMVAMKETPATWVFKDVATKIDCAASALGDDRFKLYLSIEQSWIHSGSDEVSAPKPASANGALEAPILRNFSVDTALVLRDGQTTQFTAATDPVNGDVTKIEATLNVVK